MGSLVWFAERFLWDGERPDWTWVPSRSVGPIRFGQSKEEVSAALGEPITGWGEMYAHWYPFYGVGIDTYYDQESQTLAAVAVDACRGPQVSFDGTPLVGRLPSELEPWLEETASILEDPTLPEYVDGLRFGPRGEPYLLSLGLILRCQQNGDHARCRPVFLAPHWAMRGQEWIEDLIPDREWLTY
ncbi:hypothetical protein GTY67_09810 [Streptomyces sp. SID8374]|uniref:hypothetical protein n=1 Tax=Streptomyces sp. SID8374 TaxID=2690354 RepID=UPI001370FF10|nr:hypothetical protein [Streptomyces sp. SID8374]MYX13715.1 hypothetical protein [Streptomyces sp. SID8374]